MNVKKSFRKIHLILIFSLIATIQCISQQTTSTMEVPNLLETPTATLELKVTRSATSTASPQDKHTALPDFIGLDSGKYILVQSSENNSPYLYMVSTDNTVARQYSLDGNIDTSADGRQLLIMQTAPERSYLYDFAERKWSELLINGDCANASWSPDKRQISLSCINQYVGEIYIFDTISNSMFQVTNCLETDNSCSKPAWSFNGQWLSYFRNNEQSGIHERGIQVFDTGCIESDNCMDVQSELIESNSNAVWSLDNKLILFNQGAFQFLTVENDLFVLQEEIKNSVEGFIDLDYSPDGEYLAYTSDGYSINLFSPLSGKTEQIFNSNSLAQIIGWIEIR
ncbi:MAG TPA: hypothetical protein PKE62_15365 [Anaerolineales bacterium]|nr:hypothetical protein [Anaerolineales bacterium]